MDLNQIFTLSHTPPPQDSWAETQGGFQRPLDKQGLAPDVWLSEGCSVLITVIISLTLREGSFLEFARKAAGWQTSSCSLIIRKGETRSPFLPMLLFIQYVRKSAWDTEFLQPDYCLCFSKWNLQSWASAEKLEHFFTNLQKVCFNRRDQPRGSRGGSWLLLSGCALLMWTSHSNGFSQTPQQTHSLTLRRRWWNPGWGDSAHPGAERNHPASSSSADTRSCIWYPEQLIIQTLYLLALTRGRFFNLIWDVAKDRNVKYF